MGVSVSSSTSIRKCLPYQYWVLTLSLYCSDTADSAMCFKKQNKHLQTIVLRKLKGEESNTDSRAGDMLFFLCGWGYLCRLLKLQRCLGKPATYVVLWHLDSNKFLLLIANWFSVCLLKCDFRQQGSQV